MVENKLNPLKHQEKCKQIAILDWLKSEIYCFDFANDCYLINSILTLRRLMSYIYGAPILDVSRSHTMAQHSR